MLNNKNFYPTPYNLIQKMWHKIQDVNDINNILEPSAGKGDILEYINEKSRYYKLSCIEKDENLQHILTGKKFKLIDSDFLDYSGLDKFDLIIANPPFDEGDKHLLKAIDIMYPGEIIFLLNAETIKNPYTNIRQELVRRLEELNADIEYIQDAFLEADRKTSVEIALIHIKIERHSEDDLFNDSTDKIKEQTINIEENNELASSNKIEALIEEFNATIKEGLDFFQYYHQNKRIQTFLDVSLRGESEDNGINSFIAKVRKRYWERVLDLKNVKDRMTKDKRKEFYDSIEKQSDMDFTANNIRSFILRLIGSYEDILTAAVADIFDKMTHKYHWCDETSKNAHYYNGWKTNKAFFCNKKVILPMGRYGEHGFRGSSGWQVGYQAKPELHDIDIVMNYFSGEKDYVSIVEALEEAFKEDISRNVKSTYFNISVYKKGTIHLTFRDENIRRRFNITACKHKKWLQEDYGNKDYNKMSGEEKAVVNEFEGKESYTKNINQIGFARKNMLQIELAR